MPPVANTLIPARCAIQLVEATVVAPFHPRAIATGTSLVLIFLTLESSANNLICSSFNPTVSSPPIIPIVAGATPATIGIIGGELTVGLNDEQIRLLAEDSSVKKISTRDVPVAIARGWNGATTVASTSWIAHRAGIRVFATGGIGGVHRGVLPDISAD